MLVSQLVCSALSHISMKLVAMRSSKALGLVLAGLVCLVGYGGDDSPQVASADGGAAQPAEGGAAMPGPGMADSAGQARSSPIEFWNVWGPSWGKSGL